jgi:2'-5' RNA ligase
MADADLPQWLLARYDALWAEAAPAVRVGRVTLDEAVLRKDADPRRGLTLLARPEPTVVDRLTSFLERLRALEPGQYYQPAADLHHTVLSLFTATSEYEPFLAHLDLYRAAVEEVVAQSWPFEIAVRGVTLSAGAVLAQGFPGDDTLDVLRERLRAALTARGLGATLDQRYRLVTAHTTLVRFATPLRDAERFVDALAASRDTAFGASRITAVELVLSDWYHSSDRERALGAYVLRPPALHR